MTVWLGSVIHLINAVAMSVLRCHVHLHGTIFPCNNFKLQPCVSMNIRYRALF